MRSVRRGGRRWGVAPWLAAGALLAGGCASVGAAPAAGEGVPRAEAADSEESALAVPSPPLPAAAAVPPVHPPTTGTPAVPSPELRSAPPSTPAPDPDSDRVRRELIVLDEGTSVARPTPGELARATRRAAAARPGRPPTITNENLSEYAQGARVSVLGPAPAAAEAGGEAAAGEEPTAAETAAAPELRGETYWRGRAREIREEWRRTLDEIEELEAAAADLRWQFYAEDDPWVRDGRVKPEWDRVLDRLSEARNALEGFPRRLEELREEGRRAGALPGWLREGIELQPTADELPAGAADPAEPVEPPEVHEGPPGEPR